MAMTARALVLVSLVASGSTAASEAQAPVRVPLASVPIEGGKTVSRVETTRVDFAPGQAMPAHTHTAPVVCFVTRGDFRVRIGDAPERAAPSGSVTYEPPGAVVHYFRNASRTEPAELRCAALAGEADREISIMLPPERADPGGD